MLILEQIHLETAEPLTKARNAENPEQVPEKMIRMSCSNVAAKTKQPARALSETKFVWSGSIAFPVLYGQKINLEIYNRHKFGYNPQDLQNILMGSFTLSKNDKYQRIPVYRSDSEGSRSQGQSNESHHQQEGNKSNSKEQPVGWLHTNIRVSSIIPQKVASIMPQNQKLVIKSLVAHLPNLKQKKTYIDIKVGSENKQTPFIRSRGGEIVFMERYQIPKSSYINEAVFEVFTLIEKDNSTKLVASGTLALEDEYPPRKFTLYSPKGQELGEVFISCQQMGKRMEKEQKINCIVEKPRLSMDASKVSRYQENLEESKLSSRLSRMGLGLVTQRKSFLELKGVESTGNQNESQNKDTISLASSLLLRNSRSSRLKKLSVISSNNDIVMPQEKRFQNYQDKQSENVSYLRNRNTLEMREEHSGRFYRGAAIGMGEKTDFVSKGSPGVGEYKLPSIWDRY